MNDEKLIESVRKYNVLYDLSHAKYMDINFKNNIWRQIGKQMKTEGQICKTRWSNIRDTFRKYLRKNITKSGQFSKITKRYKYADQLSFLKKHFTERETKTNFSQQESAEIIPADEDSDYSNEKEQNLAATSQETNADPNEAIQETSSQIEDWSALIQKTEILPVQKQSSTSEMSTGKHRVTSSQPTAASQLMDYLIAKNEMQVTTAIQQSAVDAFLIGITPGLKLLSPLNFHFAKSEIFSIVQKYELKSLEEQHTQGFNYNYAHQQSQYIEESANANSSTALSVVSPVSSCQYSSTINTPTESPECTHLRSPSVDENTSSSNNFQVLQKCFREFK